MDSAWIESMGGWPRVAAYAAAAILVLVVLKKLFARPPVSLHTTQVRCDSCGWTGTVSKYKPICPKCAKKLSL
jgi:hypothetical protein